MTIQSKRSSIRAMQAAFAMTALLAFICGASGVAQTVTSNSPTVTITATLPASISVAVGSGTMSFPLVAGGVSAGGGSATVTITTTWALGAQTSLVLYSSFASSTAALTNAGLSANIPSSAVLGAMATGTPTTATAFSQTNTLGTAAAGLLLFTQAISSGNYSGTRTDSLVLTVDLSSLTSLPAAAYTGVLTLQAQAT